ncbi:DUF6199 family natural product biosynthesis protein [Haladaptatus sp. NG-WS-4]
MVVFEPVLVGLLLAGLGIAIVTRPREIFSIRQSVASVPAADPGGFGVARLQAYGLLCVLAGVVLVVVPLFLP